MRLESPSTKAGLVLCSLFLGSTVLSSNAAAEKILSKDGDWTLWSEGRAGGFVSYVRGDGYPNDAFGDWINPATGQSGSGKLHDVVGGGLPDVREQGVDANGRPTQGTLEGVRVRSGMIGN
ncbi:MAG: hypothetical protein ABIS92_00190, partial [Polyangia bacterium]